MFSAAEQISRATRDLVDHQTALAGALCDSFMGAGMAVTELNIDALKTLFATTTVASRQWWVPGGACGWMLPVTQQGAAVGPWPPGPDATGRQQLAVR